MSNNRAPKGIKIDPCKKCIDISRGQCRRAKLPHGQTHSHNRNRGYKPLERLHFITNNLVTPCDDTYPPYHLKTCHHIFFDGREGHEDGLKAHCGLVLTNAEIPSVFSCSPGSDAVLVTLQHVMRMKWNSMTALSNTCGLGLTLITCPAFVTVQGFQLKLDEKFALEIKPKRGGRNKQHEHDPRELALGMEVTVTFDASMDLDVASRARGYIVDTVLDERRRRPEELTQCDYGITVSVCSCQ